MSTGSIQSSISGFAEEVLHTQARIPGNLHISLHLWFWDWCLHDTVTNPSTEGTLGATPELKACTCQRQHEGKHLCCSQNVFNLQHKFIGSLSPGGGGGGGTGWPKELVMSPAAFQVSITPLNGAQLIADHPILLEIAATWTRPWIPSQAWDSKAAYAWRKNSGRPGLWAQGCPGSKLSPQNIPRETSMECQA